MLTGEVLSERQRQIVASRLDKYHIGIGESGLHLLDSRQIHRGVLPDSGMWASTRLDTNDTILDEYALQHFANMLGIFGRYDIVCDYQSAMPELD